MTSSTKQPPFNAATFFEKIIVPTYQEYLDAHYDFRRVLLAAIVLVAAPEYIAHEAGSEPEEDAKTANNLKDEWANENKDFQRASLLANAAKHGRLRRGGYAATPSSVTEPAMAGVMFCGDSFVGDEVGDMRIDFKNDENINVHTMMANAFQFVSDKIRAHGGDVKSYTYTDFP